MVKRQIAFDVETTGLEYKQGHRIIEIGAIELVDRQITGNDFHSYLNPECQIDEGAVAIHGLTRSFLADKPVFSEIVQALIQFIQGAELIIHNAAFDEGFLNYELSLLPETNKRVDYYCEVFDTLQLARQLHPGQRNNLDALCKRYNVDNSQRELHGALIDAQLLAKVYLAMTGGQTSLFSAQEKGPMHIPKAVKPKVNSKQRARRVIRANAEELKADKEIRELIRKQREDTFDS